jgi:hypothetical protein
MAALARGQKDQAKTRMFKDEEQEMQQERNRLLMPINCSAVG